MTDTSHAHQLRGHDTQLGLLILSLDSLQDHADALALSFERPEGVKAAVRACAQWWADPSHNPAAPAGEIFQAVRAALAQEVAPTDVRRVTEWLDRFVSVLAVSSWADGWSSVLLRLTPDALATLRPVGLGTTAAATLSRAPDDYRRRFDAIEALDQAIVAAATSDWDREQVRRYQYEGDVFGPTVYLVSWLHTEMVLALLGEVTRAMTPAEVALFEAWAKVTAGTAVLAAEARAGLAPARALAGRFPVPYPAPVLAA